MIDVDNLKTNHNNFVCLMYVCKKCKRLNASKISVDLFSPISPQLNKKYKATKKVCNYCIRELSINQFYYFSDKYCDKASAFHYLQENRECFF